MKTVTINDEHYYNTDDLIKIAPIFYKGCKNSRGIIQRHNIKTKYFTYARNINGLWIESDGKSKKFDRLFINKSWIKKNVPEFNDKKKYDTEMAPSIIELNKKEKFRDNDNNIIDVEVRGVRECNKCYFDVNDISEGFCIKRLRDIIVNKNREGYTENTHYKYFNVKKHIGDGKNIIKKKLYLTYLGLLQVLFTSKKETTEKFVTWATETLFTTHLGTKEQKTKLSSKLLGIPAESVKEVFNKTSNQLPCIYLFTLGKVKDLHKSFKFDETHNDDDIVAKIGLTKDIDRRIQEHLKKYGSKEGVMVRLKMYNYIDPQYLYDAETQLKSMMVDMGYALRTSKKYKELIVYKKENYKKIEKIYQMLSEQYAGHIKEMQLHIKDLENKNVILQKDLQLKNMELLKKDDIIKLNDMKHENELLKIKIGNYKKND